VSDRWESWLSQVADAETKQAMRQHLHLSKLFFHYFSRYFKDHDAKIRTIFLALSSFVQLCPFVSIYVQLCPAIVLKKLAYIKKNQ
jgi:hypothetical protein